ncbi:MAG: A/G-specific adenine glycosylase [Filifactor alocis]|nr:A/G-specific adenine glycosylase [Filifactor alocis]
MSQDPTARTIEASYFQNRLLEWYHRNKRSMPWRDDPTAYHVWISEIMLQQTRVDAVRNYYLRFIERLPDIQSLADVDDDELHKLWEGLGYYNRAKNLKKTAQLLIREYDGELPSTFDELLKLHGIGPYTAGAVASIAFRQAVPAVDGNVMRVISRLTGDVRDIMQQSTRKAMEEVVRDLIPPDEVHHFNQALMELGALVCIPNGSPKCTNCPVNNICYAYETGAQNTLPVKKEKKKRVIRHRSILVFVNEKNEFLIQKRGETGLLSGLWEFVSVEGEISTHDLKLLLKQKGLSFRSVTKIEDAKHIFSHIEWRMHGYLIKASYTGPFTSSADVVYPYEIDLSKESLVIRESEGSLLPDLSFRPEQVWCNFDTMKKTYGIPTAFKAYLTSIEKGLIKDELDRADQKLPTDERRRKKG